MAARAPRTPSQSTQQHSGDAKGTGIASRLLFAASPLTIAQNLLWCICLVYLAAFLSLYVQIPGLYAHNGLLPADSYLRRQVSSEVFESGSLLEQVRAFPTAVWVFVHIGVAVDVGMEAVCLLGAVAALLGLCSTWGRSKFSFVVMWAAYYSLHALGQTFLWFQWDSLLLEVGALAVLLAPWLTVSIDPDYDPGLPLALFRWLLFRLQFASGVVKLTSGCPTWWDLSALTWHFESQCIPTPLAWAARLVPGWMLRFGVASTYLFLMGGGACALLPLPGLRLLGFVVSVALQVLIAATGNYNFFNIATVVLCLPMLADELQLARGGPRYRLANRLSLALSALVAAGMLAAWAVLFEARVQHDASQGWHIHTAVAFTQQAYGEWVDQVTWPLVLVGAAAMAVAALHALYRAASTRRALPVLRWAAAVAVAGAFFWLSAVPFAWISHPASQRMPAFATALHDRAQALQLSSSYGLFRRMTGVGGRPEVVVEVTRDHREWTEVDFRYKPTNVSEAPPFIVPHQPRLDWQMWFAALGSFEHNPWLVNLAIKLMRPSPPVLNLLPAHVRDDILHRPPVAVRMHMYKYHFTEAGSADWWWRERTGDYMTQLDNSNKWCDGFLKHYGFDAAEHRPSTPAAQRITRTLAAGRRLLQRLGDVWWPRYGPDGFVRGTFWSILLAKLISTLLL